MGRPCERLRTAWPIAFFIVEYGVVAQKRKAMNEPSMELFASAFMRELR